MAKKMSDYDFFAFAFRWCLEELSRASRRGGKAAREQALLDENLQEAKGKLGREQAQACLAGAADEVRRYGLLDEAILAEAKGRL